jgi:hypothetical protein
MNMTSSKGKRSLSIIAAALIIILASIFDTRLIPVQGSQQHSIDPSPTELPEQSQSSAGAAFTYQGQLHRDGQPVNEDCEMVFRLYDQPSGGALVGSPISASATIRDGYFTQVLDFGSSAFNGEARWLDIAVRCPGDDELILLADRQELTPAPYTLYASSAGSAPWGGLTGMPAGFADQVDNDLLGSLECADGQTLKWDGTVWACGEDDIGTNAGGDITAVSAGTGLTGGGESGDLVLEADATYLQRRLKSNCPVGSAIRTIEADGTPVCQLDAPLNRASPPYANRFSMIDFLGWVGHPAITIGADGLGLISYYDEINSDLKVAHCSDSVCTAATVTTLDSDGRVGWHSSIAIGADGLGLISYFDYENENLKVAHCSDVYCTSATITTLDDSGYVGWDSSVMIGADGLGLISYSDAINGGHLKIAHCSDVNCSSATITTLDSADYVGAGISVTLGADGLALISYYGGGLRVAHCSDVTCSSGNITTVDNFDYGDFTSITIGLDGLGLISYQDSASNDLKVAHCSNVSCASATITTLSEPGSLNADPSITIGADGLGLISYTDTSSFDLKVAHCSNMGCTLATIVTLDDTERVFYPSVTIGVDGQPLVSYFDDTNFALKVAHCANPFCTQYFRRR